MAGTFAMRVRGDMAEHPLAGALPPTVFDPEPTRPIRAGREGSILELMTRKGWSRMRGWASLAYWRGAGAIALSTALLTPAARAEPNQYLCIADQETGFHYNAAAGQWQPTNFRPDGKFVFRALNADDLSGPNGVLINLRQVKPTWALFDFSAPQLPQAFCSIDKRFDPKGFFNCEKVIAVFRFDQASGRFQVYLDGSYMDETFLRAHPPSPDPTLRDDIVVEIGRCSSF